MILAGRSKNVLGAPAQRAANISGIKIHCKVKVVPMTASRLQLFILENIVTSRNSGRTLPQL